MCNWSARREGDRKSSEEIIVEKISNLMETLSSQAEGAQQNPRRRNMKRTTQNT